MKDALKLALVKEILNSAFEFGVETADGLSATIAAAIVVIEFEGEDNG